MHIMQQILVPIFICVVLPVAIVLISALTKMNGDNKRATILIKAIESGSGIDANRLAESLRKPRKSERDILNLRLLRGCMFSLIGIVLIIIGCLNIDFPLVPVITGCISLAVGFSYLTVYFVSRRQLSDEK